MWFIIFCHSITSRKREQKNTYGLRDTERETACKRWTGFDKRERENMKYSQTDTSKREGEE